MSHDTRLEPEPPMKPGEVAELLRVDVKTVTRWVKAGKLRSFRTPGGQHRFYPADVRAILNGGQQ